MTLQNTNLVANVNRFDLASKDIAIVIHFEVDTKSEWHRKEKCDVQTNKRICHAPFQYKHHPMKIFIVCEPI